MWWSWNNWFLTVSILGGCGGLERRWFLTVYIFGVDVVVLKEVIFNSFYFWLVWWSWNNWFLTVSTFGWMWWSWNNWFLTVSIFWLVWWSWKKMIFNSFYYLGGCGGLERRWFLTVSNIWRMWWSWKKMIFNSFYFGWMWWSWKKRFLTVSIFGGCGGLERSDF